MSLQLVAGATHTEFVLIYPVTPSFIHLFSAVASQALDTLAQLVDDPKPAIVKVVIQCLSTMYPLLFRQL